MAALLEKESQLIFPVVHIADHQIQVCQSMAHSHTIAFGDAKLQAEGYDDSFSLFRRVSEGNRVRLRRARLHHAHSKSSETTSCNSEKTLVLQPRRGIYADEIFLSFCFFSSQPWFAYRSYLFWHIALNESLAHACMLAHTLTAHAHRDSTIILWGKASL